MVVENKMHDAFSADAYYTPMATAVYCRNCGTRLKVFYAEDCLYSVKCGYCETITLVRASNPTEAMLYVGDFERSK